MIKKISFVILSSCLAFWVHSIGMQTAVVVVRAVREREEGVVHVFVQLCRAEELEGFLEFLLPSGPQSRESIGTDVAMFADLGDESAKCRSRWPRSPRKASAGTGSGRFSQDSIEIPRRAAVEKKIRRARMCLI